MRLSAVTVFGSSTKARIRLRLRVVSSPASAVQAARGLLALSPGVAHLFPPRRVARAARGLCALSPGMLGLFPPRPQRAPGLRTSLYRNRGLFAGWEGVAFLGLSFPLSPPPPPPTSSGDGAALLWSFSVPLFCEPLAVCSGLLIFPCYPTV